MKQILVLFLALFLPFSLYAQGRGKATTAALQAATAQPATHATVQTFTRSPLKVSQQLARRTQRTYYQAAQLERELQEQTFLAVFVHKQAAKRLTRPVTMEMLQQLYPHINPLIHTRQQGSDYFVAQNNRAILKYAPDQTAHLLLMQQNIEHLQQTQQFFNHDASRDMDWLAKKVPYNTDYLLLGEIHDVPQIHQAMTLLIPALRKRFKNRPIIWLTEFMPEQLDFKELLSYKGYVDIPDSLLLLWFTLNGHRIPIQGLEPFPVFTNDSYLRESWFRFPSKRVSMWETLEGIRLRNQYWLKEIDAVRKQNPNALIIVHAGMGHLDYTHPYSVSTALKPLGHTFTVSLAPGYPAPYQTGTTQLLQNVPELKPQPCPPDGYAQYTLFDYATRGYFPQRILQFGPTDWFITGFDVQIKIPAPPSAK